MGFQPVSRSARFVYSPYTPEQMRGFAQILADSVKMRIQRGLNTADVPAAPLSMRGKRYKRYFYIKKAKGLNPIRDWTFTGHTLSCMKVLEANENRAIIGFLPAMLPGRSRSAAQIAFYNNMREPQFGTSPTDKQAVLGAFQQEKQQVTIQRTAVAA
jgi:hypothetical protein